ncbi:DNA (cytosine-5-)-methyltransferase [Sporomusa sp.]|uniref:DNA cytosine methyltransferase n=1 Tax=Sporomusa sp. TaxID=2078658 RepID=UPI002D196565|nr:DNA (cytosine-5-)-methyltransferase [Sporomusa sp.]HWR42277.1 DNA (cytosine-5-)-methyltransferase [Sporomusa sp.]
MSHKIISLFSGAGGLDIGFEEAGFEIAVAVEADSSCCDTLRRNCPNLIVLEGNIEDFSSEQILQAAGLKPLEAALVIGGPPCQPFSLAGNRLGLDDPRGHLLKEFIRVVRETLPIGFVLENVRGLLNWDNGSAKELLLEELSKPIEFNGQVYQYKVADPKVLNAVDYGVAQKRERVFFVGNRLGLPFKYPEPSHVPCEQAMLLNKPQHKNVWDAIGALPHPDEPSETAQRVAQTIKGRIASHGY